LVQEYNDLKQIVDSVKEEIPRHREPDEENDKFYEVMKAFMNINLPLFTQLGAVKDTMLDSFAQSVDFFGEDPATTSEGFFGIFCQFIITFDRARKENLIEAEMQRKQEELQKLEKERAGKRAHKQQKMLGTSKRGIMDELVSSLKAGDFISQAAEERRKNKRISRALEKGDLDAEKLLQELRSTYS
jgi:Formin Homology 2 Domain